MIALSVWTGYFWEILTLFLVVLLHELGHVTAAWSFGWKIRSIELLPFGGVAQMDEWGTAPAREEIMVALAGPFYHIYMILFSLWFYQMGWWDYAWTEYFVLSNITIALFNLLPIYPLDGGRVVQALLSKLMPYQRCIAVSLYTSLFLSLVLLLFAFTVLTGISILPLAIIGLFLVFSNWRAIREQQYPLWRMLFQRYQKGASDTLPHQVIQLMRTDSWAKIVPQWRKERYHFVQVYHENGQLMAIYPEEKVLERLFQIRRKGA